MPDVREIPAVLEAATHAAAAGDLAAAQAHLHDVVRLQEASLGPLHPDLASTFNNLAVVCEMANKPAEAEQFYRRAYAIASASLDPGDPLVTTSRNNLEEFCQTRGIATNLAVAVPAATAAVTAPEEIARPAVGPERAERIKPPRMATPATPAPSQPGRSSRALVVGVIAAAALLTAVVMFWSRGQPDIADSADAALAGTSSEPLGSREPVTAPVADAPAPVAPLATPPAARSAPAPPTPPVVDAPTKTAVARPASQSAANTRVLEAGVCRSLSTGGAKWDCVAPSNPAASGRLYFYTRVAASQNERVRHRWYHGDRLVQDVGLDVRANPSAGYRTYSRQTVNAVGGGDWRVEITSADGTVLQEEQIVVR